MARGVDRCPEVAARERHARRLFLIVLARLTQPRRDLPPQRADQGIASVRSSPSVNPPRPHAHRGLLFFKGALEPANPKVPEPLLPEPASNRERAVGRGKRKGGDRTVGAHRKQGAPTAGIDMSSKHTSSRRHQSGRVQAREKDTWRLLPLVPADGLQ